jgi:hypothetical protein
MFYFYLFHLKKLSESFSRKNSTREVSSKFFRQFGKFEEKNVFFVHFFMTQNDILKFFMNLPRNILCHEKYCYFRVPYIRDDISRHCR